MHTRTVAFFSLAVLTAAINAFAREAPRSARKTLEDGRVEDTGVITPLDDNSFYIRNNDGQTEVRFNDKTEVLLTLNYRKLGNVADDAIRITIHSSDEEIVIPLPPGLRYAKKYIRPASARKETAEAMAEKWLSCRGLEIFCKTKIDSHLPTGEAPYFGGKFTFSAKRTPAKMTIGDKTFEVSMKKGGQTNVLLHDVYTTKDCKPFVNKATVTGRLKDGAILADRITLLPIGDSTRGGDPKLPRYLFIGDSISGNYDRGLRAALKGKVNPYHPPTNCGPTGKGVAEINNWLGAYDVKDRRWDVISFNFGHWNAGSTKQQYQKDLEFIISQLEKTGAKLIWVTTAPVPLGYGKGEIGRKAGRMKLQNEWAAEVTRRHPKITVCDQWQFVKDNRDGVYTEWWKGKNVHFGGRPADGVGRLLAEHVMKVLKEK